MEKCINENGQKWSLISKILVNRTGKQIRERYINRLDEILIKTPFTLLEDIRILKLHKQFGNDWKLISNNFDGRPPDIIKNRYNSTVKHNGKILLFLERRDLGISESEQKSYFIK